ncbi:MAG: vitamin K epoxide reductase family protein, partial [Fidelibacterota bacterium]
MSSTSIILALLAVTGWAFSYYFLQVYRGKISPSVSWMPKVCRMSAGSCRTVAETSYGKTFGKPNAFWGSLFYPVLFLAVIAEDLAGLEPWIVFTLSTASVGGSLYLTWGLYRLRVLCRVCMATHATNVLFFIIV